MEKIHQFTPDLLFVDINMPVLNGLELIHSLDQPPMVIKEAFQQYVDKNFL